MRQAAKIKKTTLNLSKLKLALVVSRFNPEICEGLLEGALKALKEMKVPSSQIKVIRVPGAFEIPMVAKQCAQSSRFHAVICLGAVIRGDTPHFDMICQWVTQGIGMIGLETGKPVIFGVITTNSLSQAKVRSHNDEFNKGREAALAAMEVMGALDSLKRGKRG